MLVISTTFGNIKQEDSSPGHPGDKKQNHIPKITRDVAQAVDHKLVDH
jgi:hypothetical protein